MGRFHSAVLLGFFGCVALLAADRDLGKELPFKINSGGRPAFGAVYTYGNDRDGLSYLLTFTPNVSPAIAAQNLRWNYYVHSRDSFLLSWSASRKVSLAIIQVKLDERTSGHEGIINQIVAGQKKISGRNEISFVLASEQNVPLYHVPISTLCASYPGNFSDLTYSKKCDEISP